MATLLYRLGAFAVRRRWAVLLVWIVLLAGVGGAALAFKGVMTDSFSIPGTQAQQALNQLNAKIPAAGGASGRIVFAAPAGHTLAEPEYQQAIKEVLAGTTGLPKVQVVIPPAAGASISPAGTVSFAQVQFAGQLTEIPVDTQTTIANLAATHEVNGLRIELGGGAVKQAPSIGSTEGLGVVVALVVLLITFGSVVAAGMTMLTALIGVAVGLSGILWASGVIQMSSTAPILALMIGLAVGIDYALFIVSRHRAQARAGMVIEESIARATGTAGSAVVFAGLTVLIALAGLSVVGIPFLTVMGLAAAATVAIAVLIAVTLVPALLGFAGDKVLKRKDRAARTALVAGDGVDQHAVVDHAQNPNRWIRMVTKRPALVLIATVVGMGIIALPTAKLHLALPDDGSGKVTSTKRQAYDLLAGSFGPGFNGPLIVTVSAPPASLKAAMATVVGDINGLPEKPRAAAAGASKDGTLGVVQVIPATGPSNVLTEDLVNDLRKRAGGWEQQTASAIAVTGQTAVAIDVSEKLSNALPVYLLIVVGLALILLLLIFRSIVVPVKAALGFLLSVGVSFGAVVAVYQWGWLGGLFNVDTPAPIISFLPILLIGVLFGLAMDYQVFMVSGMREAYVHGADAKRAVVGGFTAGSRVVTAAAIIMTSVFSGFILAPDTIIASIGFALGIGVLADAFLVRMTIVPAVMTLLGRAAWYIPRWLDRVLPSVDIEGEKLLEKLRTDAGSGSPVQPQLVGVAAGGAGGDAGGGGGAGGLGNGGSLGNGGGGSSGLGNGGGGRHRAEP